MTEYSLQEFKIWLVDKNKVRRENINNKDWLDFYDLIQKLK